MPEPASRAETVLGFDFGERRIGVAVGNTLTGGATPVTIIDAHQVSVRFDEVRRLVEKWQPDRFVVGWLHQRPFHDRNKLWGHWVRWSKDQIPPLSRSASEVGLIADTLHEGLNSTIAHRLQLLEDCLVCP
jgi:hypothetical protein